MIPKSRLRLIPREFHVAHKFSFYLHDLLAEVVIHGELSFIFDTNVKFRSPQDADGFRKCDPFELFEWLKEHDYFEELRAIICRQCIVALLSDMCHFIYEALNASEKAKLTICYTLLRKPLKDNLFYLEWMLADREKFVDYFLDGALESLDHSRLTPQERLAIIKLACANAPYPSWLDPQLVSELRYDKRSEWGLAGMFDKAHHLITTHPTIRTENANLNFVFSNDEDRHGQWAELYQVLPQVLMHAIEIIEGLLMQIATLHEPEATIRRIQRLVGWAFSDIAGPSSDGRNELRHVANEILDELRLDCPGCGKRLKSEGHNLLRFFVRCRLRCSNCSSVLSLPTRPPFGYCVIDEAELAEFESVEN